jgi:hypothetical protein
MTNNYHTVQSSMTNLEAGKNAKAANDEKNVANSKSLIKQIQISIGP